MATTNIYLWQKLPVLRLLIPLVIGVYIQWYLPFSITWLIGISILSAAFFFISFFFSLKNVFRFAFINGICIHLLGAMLGAGLVVKTDKRNDAVWFGKHYKKGDYLVVRLLEPLVEKQNSFKALADVQSVGNKAGLKKASGKILLYFRKNAPIAELTYGSQIVFNTEAQPIKNAGNPGSFNYQQFCLFQGITHQVNSLSTDFLVLEGKKTDFLSSLIFSIRRKTVATLQRFIKEPRDAGLAEALLIGFKDDLDKNLVQAYSNTGVVHIIAISGLHLGLIYGLMNIATKRFRRNKKANWIRVALMIGVLWAFSLVAGAQPSVMRSTVMFTCLAAGELFNKKSSSINALLFSTFLLLCYNPFWLWDVGFQLSYSAVLSLIIFYKPIYNWVAPVAKMNKWTWGLTAATLAAQILTLPLVIYHFHQFPLLFLAANIIAVPWSSGILIGELLLLLLSFIEPVAVGFGWLLQKAIYFMNAYIESLSSLPYAVWNGFSISVIQAAFLYVALGALAYWLIEQNKKAIWAILAASTCFVVLRSVSFANAYHQKEMIVYDVPKHQAIDVIEGRAYRFIGDANLIQDDFVRNFHLQPSRILHRTTPLEGNNLELKYFSFGDKKIMIIDSTVAFNPANKTMVDVIILSKNPKIYMKQLANAFSVKEVVMDGSVPLWKKNLWKQDCDSLHLHYHDVADKGAFVMRVQ